MASIAEKTSKPPPLIELAEPDPSIGNELRLDHNKAVDHTAITWPTYKKWLVLVTVFIMQTSMNFNASIYGNAVPGLKEEFGIDTVTAKYGQWIFLILYGFGCELWAPFSEEFGRKPIMQTSLLLVNVFQLPCALAQNFSSVVVGRAFGGLSSAGGSVTLGICADMYLPQDQQYAVAFVVLSSVGGSVVGPIVGGFITEFLNWRWVFWVQFIFGVATQLLHFFFCPETDPHVILDRKAKMCREGVTEEETLCGGKKIPGGEHGQVWGPRERKKGRFGLRKILGLMWRPYKMLLTEPIVLFLSLLSGFSDALIFSFLDSYGLVFSQWHFNHWQLGLAFVPLAVGYCLAYLSFWPFYRQDIKAMTERGAEAITPERRLYWLLWLAPLEAVGLFAFGALSLGPDAGIPWIAPLLVSTLVGIANYAIYLATIDYMVASYGHYAASATGGNGFARDVLAGIAALYTGPFYANLPGPYSLQKPTWIFACLAVVVIIPLYVFYFKGEWFRERSPFAKEINEKRRAALNKLGSSNDDERPAGADSESVGGASPILAKEELSKVLVEEEAGSGKSLAMTESKDSAERHGQPVMLGHGPLDGPCPSCVATVGSCSACSAVSSR